MRSKVFAEIANELPDDAILATNTSSLSVDALADAVVQGQIDVAISAISATVERAEFVDFSNIYFVGEDAVIMRSDVPGVVLTDVSDLAGQRIGVQKLSVYEDWLYDELVATGLTSAALIFTYQDADQMIQ